MRALREVERIVVIDHASEDDTRVLLSATCPDVLVVSLPSNLGAAARNVGMRLVANRYVALCNDDTWWEPGCLQRACRLLESHPRVAVVSASVLLAERRTIPAAVEAQHRLVSRHERRRVAAHWRTVHTRSR
jgi:GT2 family glycosyltransferase